MTDTRWADVLMSVDSAVRHFAQAARIFDQAPLGLSPTFEAFIRAVDP